jgi:hypothetical protein
LRHQGVTNPKTKLLNSITLIPPKPGYTGIDILQLRNRSGIMYREALYSSRYSKSDARRLNMKKQQKDQYSGKMTPGARKRLARCITLMCQAVKARWVFSPVINQYVYHKLSFITLTISDVRNITHREAYDKCFKHFLQWLRRTKGVNTYIWKAELQKRGQIHYHITTPAYIDYREIRKEWNELQRDAGLLDNFFEKFGHYDPNSTDIHEVRNVKKMDSYLVKELAKSVQNIEATEGKIWDCSDNLAGKKYYSVTMTNEHFKKMDELILSGHLKIISYDFFDIVEFNDFDPPNLLNDLERQRLTSYLDNILNDDGNEVEPIPAECVQMEMIADVTKPLTFSQLQIFLN